MLNLLIEHFLNPLPHGRDRVVWAVKGDAVGKNQSHICYELVHIEVAGILWVGVRFRWIGGGKLVFNGGEVNRVLYNRRVVWDIECDGINRAKEGPGIFVLLQLTDSRTTKAVLKGAEC